MRHSRLPDIRSMIPLPFSERLGEGRDVAAVRSPTHSRRAFLGTVAGTAGLLISAAGCATYQFGNQSLYPPDVQTVYVPMFRSNSYYRYFGEQLTEAVIKQIQEKTPYTVVGSPDADSVLTGTLLTNEMNVLVDTNTDETRELQIDMFVNVVWTKRSGEIMGGPYKVAIDPEYVEIEQTTNLVPEVGQTYVSQQTIALDRMAEQIVSLMENSW